MLQKKDRLEYCQQCIHKVEHKRYGILCGLTNNYPHFSDKCEHFKKDSAISLNFDTPFKGSVTQKESKETFTSSKKKSKSWISIAFILYVVFKIVVKLLRENGIHF